MFFFFFRSYQVLKTTVRAHRSLPPGGILVFMTGRRDVEWLVAELRRRFSKEKLEQRKRERERRRRRTRQRKDEEEEAAKAMEGSRGGGSVEIQKKGEGDDDDDEDHDDEEEEEKEEEDGDWGAGAACVLPLYALLPPQEQLRVFQRPPEGERLIVVATNVAETSLTIPNIRYVVDSGREKARHYEGLAGGMSDSSVSSFRIQWVSKAAAAQRAGR